MLSFEKPLFFFFILLIPALIILERWTKPKGGQLLFPVSLWKEVTFQPFMPWVSFVRFFVQFCFWGAFFCIVAALADPVIAHRNKIYLNAGADVIIVLDESPSMGARDFYLKDRFSAAKNVIERFVKGRQNDLVGLVSFGKEAVLRVPLTLDYEFFLDRLNHLQLMSLGDGTALGMGLAVAALHLQNSQASQKVIIALTDGDNNAGEIPPANAVKLIRSLGAMLYIVGIGTQGSIPAEVTDPQTGKVYSGILEKGFQEEAMRSLAVPPWGVYFSASSAASLSSIFSAIDSRETLSKRIKIEVVSNPLRFYFIFSGFVFLFIFFLLSKVILKEI